MGAAWSLLGGTDWPLSGPDTNNHNARGGSQVGLLHSTLNAELLTAVETLARQRLLEQLNQLEQRETGEGEGASVVGASSPPQQLEPGALASGSESTSHSEEIHNTSSNRVENISYFESIYQIFIDLLSRNEIHLSLPQQANLNMQEEDGVSDGDERAYVQRYVARSTSRRPHRSLPQPIPLTPGKEACLTDLVREIYYRCGRYVWEEKKNLSSPTVENNQGYSEASTLHLLRRRELGIGSTPSYRGGYTLNGSQKASLHNRFLPNQRKLVDHVRAKTFCVGYFNNGLLTASQDHIIRLYCRGSPRNRYMHARSVAVPYVGWSILDFAISPDGSDVIYSTWNDAIYQGRLSLEQGRTEWQPLQIDADESRFGIFSIRFNASGDEIVAGASDEHIYIYNRHRGQCVLNIRGHEDDVNAVCFADQSSHLILSGSDDGLCKVWDRRTMGDLSPLPTPVGVFAGHRDGVTYIDSRGDDRYFLSNSKDQSIRIWDLRHPASSQAVENSKRAAATQQWDYRWQPCPPDGYSQLDGDCSIATLRGHSVLQTLIRARFSPDHTGKRFIYTGCAGGRAIVYDFLKPEEKRVYDGHNATVRDCIWNPDENEFVTSSWDGKTYAWRFDQRCNDHLLGECDRENGEESCDENYEPIKRRVLRRRKRRPGD